MSFLTAINYGNLRKPAELALTLAGFALGSYKADETYDMYSKTPDQVLDEARKQRSADRLIKFVATWVFSGIAGSVLIHKYIDECPEDHPCVLACRASLLFAVPYLAAFFSKLAYAGIYSTSKYATLNTRLDSSITALLANESSLATSSNTCSLKDQPELAFQNASDFGVEPKNFSVDPQDFNIDPQSYGMPLVAVAAFTAIASASVFAGYKYHQDQKEKVAKNQKALEEASKQKTREQEADAALRLKEESRIKALKEACEAVERVKHFNQTTLSSFGIHFWHIPLHWPEGAKTLGFDIEDSSSRQDAAPVFNDEKNSEVDNIKTHIQTSLESHGNAPLPNLLLSGVPGVGKTMLIANLCKTSGIGYIKIPTGLLESLLTQNKSLETLEAILKVAESSNAPVYIVLDDGEALFDKSAVGFRVKKEDETIELPWFDAADKVNSNDVIGKRRRQLVQAILDHAKKADRKASFALTTNRPNVVDDDFKEASIALQVPPPGKPERLKILVQGLPKVFGDEHQVLGYFSTERLQALSDKTEGFTGRNLIKMLETLYSLVNHDPNSISDHIIDNAVKQTIPSVELFRTGTNKN